MQSTSITDTVILGLLLFGISISFVDGISNETESEPAAAPSPNFRFIGKQGTKTFYFVDLRASWEVARTACLDNQMNMATIESQEDMDFVLRVFGSPGIMPGDVWLGGRSTSTADIYRWTDSLGTVQGDPPSLGSFVKYYYATEMGFMGLTFSTVYNSVLGLHYQAGGPKILCQTFE